MRQFRRIIGMTIILALVLCSFVSCSAKPMELTAEADEFLSANPYSVDIRVEYESEDEIMQAAISSFTGPTIKVNVDGDKFMAIMYLKSGNTQNYAQFTYVDGTLYTEYSEDGKVVESTKTFTDEDKAALLQTFGAGASVNHEDFEEVDAKTVKKVSVITCTDIKPEAIEGLTSSLRAQLEPVFPGVQVTVYTATLDIEIEDGKYNVVIFNCEYFITTGTNSYTINMKYSVKFNYDEEFTVTAPEFD